MNVLTPLTAGAPATRVGSSVGGARDGSSGEAGAAVAGATGHAIRTGAAGAGATVGGAASAGAAVRGVGAGSTKAELTAEQQAALKHLHVVAQQFESVFVNMLFRSMRAASPQTSISGEKQSPAETTFSEMLDEKRSEAMAQTGAFGIGKLLEEQLKASVLANPAQAAKARIAPDGVL